MRHGWHRKIAVKCVLQIIFVFSICYFMNAVQAGGGAFFKEKVEMQCGSHRVAITCGKAKPDDPKDDLDVRVCVHNSLSFTDSGGKVFIPVEPKNVISLGEKGNSPNDINCGKGKNGLFYVRVRFIGCPYISCEMIDLFAEDGKRLTVNGSHFGKIIKEKSIKFPEDNGTTIEVPNFKIP